MKAATVLSCIAGLAAATPLKRATYDDGTILNYALTLEHLEDTFYRQGLAKYSAADFASAGFDATFYKNLKETSLDETTHVAFLTTALKAANVTPVAACTYNFGYTSVASFVATAAILEGVGVSAYLGAAADIMSKDYLTAAGSILTVEARHSSYIRAGLKELPYAQPFDAPLDLDEVYSLAAPFFVKCPPNNPPLGLTAFPTLAATGPKPIVAGSKITLTPSKTLNAGGKTVYAAFVTVTGPIFVTVTPTSNGAYTLTVPKGVNGQSYVILTNCKEVNDDVTLAVGIVEISNPMFIPAA